MRINQNNQQAQSSMLEAKSSKTESCVNKYM